MICLAIMSYDFFIIQAPEYCFDFEFKPAAKSAGFEIRIGFNVGYSLAFHYKLRFITFYYLPVFGVLTILENYTAELSS